MLEFLPAKLGRHVKLLKVPRDERQHGVNIVGRHLPHPLELPLLRQRVPPDLVLRLAVRGKRAESYFVQLHPVQGAVVVPTGADGSGQHGAAGVEALPDTIEVAAAGHLLNEHGGEPLVPQLLVHYEEVDLGDSNDRLANPEADGDGGDESDQPPRLGRADADMVILLPAGSHEGPVHRN